MRITSKPLLEIFMIEITGICNNAYTRIVYWSIACQSKKWKQPKNPPIGDR